MPQPALAIATPVYPRENGRIFRLEATVPHFGDWEAALVAGAPDTSTAQNARQVGKFYVPPPPRLAPTRFLMMWAGPNSKTPTAEAQEWASCYGLRRTSPYEIFGLSALFPDLYKEYGLQGGGFVATQTCNLPKPHVCGVWQSETGERRAGLVETQLKFYDRTIFVYGED